MMSSKKIELDNQPGSGHGSNLYCNYSNIGESLEQEAISITHRQCWGDSNRVGVKRLDLTEGVCTK